MNVGAIKFPIKKQNFLPMPNLSEELKKAKHIFNGCNLKDGTADVFIKRREAEEEINFIEALMAKFKR